MLPLDQKGSAKPGSNHKRFVPLRRQYRRVRIRMDGRLLHCLMVSLLLFIIAVSIFQASGMIGAITAPPAEVLSSYKTSSLLILYLLRLMTLMPLPLTLFNFAGIVSFNTFPRKPKLRGSTLFGPFICFRVVTKGLFPKLVRSNVTKNLEICSQLGFDNFVFEVVTDEAVQLPKLPRVRELIVPNEYRSSKGTLYKARALNYCLEEGINYLNDNDWIVHLDEETLLTESSLVGIINFINEGKHDFGQGVITYADGEIVNWLTTLSDVVRVGMDYGMLRFCLKFLHKPVFSWKGSFIVSNAGVERKITYDFGPDGSIAEDCFFAMSAWRDGHTFGFVEGDMHEKSTFSLVDYIKQRKRWVQGILLVLFSRMLPWRCKMGLSVMILSWLTLPFTVPNIILVLLFPLPMPTIVNALCGFIGGTVVFLFIFGAIKSFSLRNMGRCQYILLCLAPILVAPLAMIMESISVIWAIFGHQNHVFDVVNKESNSTSKDLESADPVETV
ncbi:Hypothetical predicted protein [Octopus vulgaris]|uniref:Uncharacterized protein n=2 Tax=Octopus TaxID=6643 RepID=A0AA36B2N6_OCTVU|nr:beta-1,4-mannosyltransferase egh [Octopus sinensis]XP_029638564.1 beta-1,4-mannosyltransferase egh [Octopus sinensis]XP_029638565.1 beta-1,4-mannosyltransferase egh [Octopus sinensis]XP_029638566.1 beta-1,4-mannosyltransferase egh [Octopus sinensis]XP_029638567.1 beta-1,4-mannosyltransferase egh [Octopus sinensis]XP_036360683.1 beta-1,4-mannosyltransferase egh [Octopus sinensis]CAI9725772.1 Hypothetical predicted protein [Octopus vulgaris]